MAKKYVKLKRQELKELVEKEYGIKVKDMHEGDKGIVLFTTGGTKLLKGCKRDEAKLMFAVSAYEYIRAKGFKNISVINRTSNGCCWVNYENRLFILQDFSAGRIFNIRTDEEAARAGRLLAELHRAGAGFVPEAGCHARVDWGKWMEKFKSYSYNLKRFKESVEDSNSKSKLDKVFLKHADNYCDRMYRAYLILKNFGYLEKVQLSMKHNQLTHKQFRRHSMIISEQGELFICSMEDCAYDIPEVDIADLIESLSGNRKTELAKAALEGYSSVNKLDRKSVKIIQAFLLQPKRFYKSADRSYGKRKNYTESELLHKLERSVKREARKDSMIEFLENYWP
ncbi:MAG: CotS family spore coat protein [Bacillota bacterium]